jgi:hypothetical protein
MFMRLISPASSQTPLTRRTVIAGAGAAIAAVGGRALFGPLGTAVADDLTVAPDKPWKHAIGDPRGRDIASTAGKEIEARFGLCARTRRATARPTNCCSSSRRRWVNRPGAALENPDILSGEVFLGQFIDHDMTFDRTRMPEQELDRKGLVHFDSPFFDLASVYGRGPDLDPQFYEADGMQMRIVHTRRGCRGSAAPG